MSDEEMFDEPEGTDVNHERALEAFNRHPNRALSARELALLLDEDGESCVTYLLDLDDAGFIVETNEFDGDFVRYRLQEE